MYPVVGFGGYEITANAVLWGLVAYFVLSAVASFVVPALLIKRSDSDKSLATMEKVLELQEKVRSPILKFLAGAAVVSTVIVGIQAIRSKEDEFKKGKLDLFNTSSALLLDDGKELKDVANAMRSLAFVATSDPSYHRAAFDMLSAYVKRRSAPTCAAADFVRDPKIDVAVRVIAERNPDHDYTQKRFNLEHACLTEADLRDEYGVIVGLRNARLSNANLLRSDFTKADLRGAELKGVIANDHWNPTWSLYLDPNVAPDKRRVLHPGEQGDPRAGRNRLNGYERRLLVTHFVDANLAKADFSGAHLAGADFSGADLANVNFQDANLSRANFNGVQNLNAQQLHAGCVGHSKMNADELREAQPFLWEKLRKDVGEKGIKACQL